MAIRHYPQILCIGTGSPPPTQSPIKVTAGASSPPPFSPKSSSSPAASHTILCCGARTWTCCHACHHWILRWRPSRGASVSIDCQKSLQRNGRVRDEGSDTFLFLLCVQKSTVEVLRSAPERTKLNSLSLTPFPMVMFLRLHKKH